MALLRSLIVTPIGEPIMTDAVPFARLLAEKHCSVALSVGQGEAGVAWSDSDCADHLNAVLGNEQHSEIVALPGRYGILGCLPYISDPLRKSPCEFSTYGDGCLALIRLANYDLLRPIYVSNIRGDLNAFGDFVVCGNRVGDTLEDLSPARVIRPGTAFGRVVAGRLGAIASVIGTPDDPFNEPAILYLEEWGVTPERVDRDLQHIKMRAGSLVALVIGRLLEPEASTDETNLIEGTVLAFRVPTIYLGGARTIGWPVGRSFGVTF